MRTIFLRSAIALGLTFGMGVIAADAKLPNAYYRFGRITITNQVSVGLGGFSCYVDTSSPRSVSSGQFEGNGGKMARFAMENIVESLSGGLGGGFKSVNFPSSQRSRCTDPGDPCGRLQPSAGLDRAPHDSRRARGQGPVRERMGRLCWTRPRCSSRRG